MKVYILVVEPINQKLCQLRMATARGYKHKKKDRYNMKKGFETSPPQLKTLCKWISTVFNRACRVVVTKILKVAQIPKHPIMNKF